MTSNHLSRDLVTLSGHTRLFGTIGHPIAQVRAPELITAEFRWRRIDAILVPFHIVPEDFETVVPALLRLENLGDVLFTIPYKLRALPFADSLGEQAQFVRGVSALTRDGQGRWLGEAFDGIGCVEAFRRRGVGFAGQRVQVLGCGGAGTSIAVAIARERAQLIRLSDPDPARLHDVAAKVQQANPEVDIVTGQPMTDGIDILINASPVGMHADQRSPIDSDRLPPSLIVMDAVTNPERTRLLQIAEASGCKVIFGREMMDGQNSRIVDFFGYPTAADM